ncbi:hypothetical protein ABT332_13285 [Saccharomonospora azurea]|uniref:hypothetical protein n=1 Tax=Saccharomonospora azurea TaxID=40988 RepID=UPI003331A4D0
MEHRWIEHLPRRGELYNATAVVGDHHIDLVLYDDGTGLVLTHDATTRRTLGMFTRDHHVAVSTADKRIEHAQRITRDREATSSAA